MKPNTLISNCPAFYYALAAIAGVALAHDVWPPLFFVLISPLWVQRMSFLLIALGIAGETLFFTRTIPHHRLEGTGIFHVTSIRRGERSFFLQRDGGLENL